MTHSRTADPSQHEDTATKAPSLNVRKLAIVSRDYTHPYPNGYRDFSHSFAAVLALLDGRGCDAVLFSPWSIVPREGYDPVTALQLRNVKAILYEHFPQGTDGVQGRPPFVVAYQTETGWRKYERSQVFGTLTEKCDMPAFVREELPRRILGNACVLICGETNGVKYSPKDKKVHDIYGLVGALPGDVKVILNPVHDRMTRFEMVRKREFLSRGGRWVVSVWNKGKRNKNGRTMDGKGVPWTVFRDGKPVTVDRVENDLNVEIGIVDLRTA